MAYDIARRTIVMFGGSPAGTETWEWSGRQWRLRTPPVAPPERWHHAMAYDIARNRIVLFGGLDLVARPLGDTWEWDGMNWTQLLPATSPPNRSHHAMAYDVRRGRVLLYGGAGSTLFSDTWEWDGLGWRQLAPATGPIGSYSVAMATDYDRQRVLLMSPGFLCEWTGTGWLPRNGSGPIGRYGSLVYDPRRERAVLFGGSLDGNASALDETWEWDGARWTRRSPQTSPPARYWHAAAYDLVTGETVLFGGRIQSSRFADTWVYAPVHRADYSQYGSGCRGTAGVPLLALTRGLPWLGDEIVLGLSALPQTGAAAVIVGASNSQWGASRLPLDLSPIGMPGCTLLASPDLVLPVVNTGGSATLALRICDCPVLVGQSVFQQAFVGDAAANALGLIASNGGDARIGAR
jgi:hypothetical protein